MHERLQQKELASRQGRNQVIDLYRYNPSDLSYVLSLIHWKLSNWQEYDNIAGASGRMTLLKWMPL
jgi:hypothetical protein